MPKMFSRRNTLLKWRPSLGRGARVGAEASVFTQYPLDHSNLTARAAGRLCQPQKDTRSEVWPDAEGTVGIDSTTSR